MNSDDLCEVLGKAIFAYNHYPKVSRQAIMPEIENVNNKRKEFIMADFSKFKKSGTLPFMNGREWGKVTDTLIDSTKPLHIEEFGFLIGKDGSEYAVFTIKEDKNQFFSGNQIVTDFLKGVADDPNPIFRQELKDLPVYFTWKKSKNGRNYVDIVLPSDKDEEPLF